METIDLLYRCTQCGWYSSLKDLKFVKEAMKYKRFLACPKCLNMKFIVHVKKLDAEKEKKLDEKAPKIEENVDSEPEK